MQGTMSRQQVLRFHTTPQHADIEGLEVSAKAPKSAC